MDELLDEDQIVKENTPANQYTEEAYKEQEDSNSNGNFW